jgi:putative spermidine/putrescine transport system permease protein
MYKHKAITLISVLVFFFLFCPLILIIITSFNSADSISLPLKGISLKWFFQVFKSRSLTGSFKTSLILAFAASVIGTLLGLLSAIALVKTKNRVSVFLYNVFLSPSLIPGIVTGYILFKFIVVQLQIGLVLALLTGHLLIVLPYTVRIICASLRNTDEGIEEAARTLGCTPVQAFIKVILPELEPALLSAFMLAFINSFNNIPVSMYLKGPGMDTLPYAMMNYIEYNYDPTVSALSVMLMGMTLIFMLVIDHAAMKKE